MALQGIELYKAPVFVPCCELQGIEFTRVPLLATGKLIRQDLKAAFPSVKFGVRCKRSGGGWSYIVVSWEGAPDREAVEQIIARYRGEQYDIVNDYHDSVAVEIEGRWYHFESNHVSLDHIEIELQQ